MRRICPECRTVYDDMRCSILCPHEQRVNTTCRFCTEPPVAQCAWPVEKLAFAHYGDVKVGDRIKRVVEFRAECRPPAEVVVVERCGVGEIRLVLAIGSRMKEIREKVTGLLRIAGEQACGVPVCELHLRSVSDGRQYCMDHWDAWEKVA